MKYLTTTTIYIKDIRIKSNIVFSLSLGEFRNEKVITLLSEEEVSTLWWDDNIQRTLRELIRSKALLPLAKELVRVRYELANNYTLQTTCPYGVLVNTVEGCNSTALIRVGGGYCGGAFPSIKVCKHFVESDDEKKIVICSFEKDQYN